MLSDTLTHELERYRIGPRIKVLRQSKKLGLVELGSHTGLSPGMLSKVERGQLFPTLPTLMRIALVFGVGLDHFFNAEPYRVAVTRKVDRVCLPIPAEQDPPSYVFESLNYPYAERRMEAFVAEFPADGMASPPHQHAGEELVYVMAGSLAVIIDGKEETLNEGDAITFDATVPHGYRRISKDACKVIVAIAP